MISNLMRLDSLWHTSGQVAVRAKAICWSITAGWQGRHLYLTTCSSSSLIRLYVSPHRCRPRVSVDTDAEGGARPFGGWKETNLAQRKVEAYLSVMYLMLSCTLWSVRPLYDCMWKATCAKKHIWTRVSTERRQSTKWIHRNLRKRKVRHWISHSAAQFSISFDWRDQFWLKCHHVPTQSSLKRSLNKFSPDRQRLFYTHRKAAVVFSHPAPTVFKEQMLFRFNKRSTVTFGISPWQDWKWKPGTAGKEHRVHTLSRPLPCVQIKEQGWQHMTDLHPAVWRNASISEQRWREVDGFSMFLIAAIVTFKVNVKFVLCSYSPFT